MNSHNQIASSEDIFGPNTPEIDDVSAQNDNSGPSQANNDGESSIRRRRSRSRPLEENRREQLYSNLNNLIQEAGESLQRNVREVEGSPKESDEIEAFLVFLRASFRNMSVDMFREYRNKMLKIFLNVNDEN